MQFLFIITSRRSLFNELLARFLLDEEDDSASLELSDNQPENNEQLDNVNSDNQSEKLFDLSDGEDIQKRL